MSLFGALPTIDYSSLLGTQTAPASTTPIDQSLYDKALTPNGFAELLNRIQATKGNPEYFKIYDYALSKSPGLREAFAPQVQLAEAARNAPAAFNDIDSHSWGLLGAMYNGFQDGSAKLIQSNGSYYLTMQNGRSVPVYPTGQGNTFVAVTPTSVAGTYTIPFLYDTTADKGMMPAGMFNYIRYTGGSSGSFIRNAISDVSSAIADLGPIGQIGLAFALGPVGGAISSTLGISAAAGTAIAAGLVNTALTGNVESGLKAGIGSYLGAQAGQWAGGEAGAGKFGDFLEKNPGYAMMFANQVANATIQNPNNIGNAIKLASVGVFADAAVSEVPGIQDVRPEVRNAIKQEIASSLVRGDFNFDSSLKNLGVAGIASYSLNQIPGFQTIDPKLKSLAYTNLTSALQGRDLNATTLNWALSQGAQEVAQSLKKQYPNQMPKTNEEQISSFLQQNGIKPTPELVASFAKDLGVNLLDFATSQNEFDNYVFGETTPVKFQLPETAKLVTELGQKYLNNELTWEQYQAQIDPIFKKEIADGGYTLQEDGSYINKDGDRIFRGDDGWDVQEGYLPPLEAQKIFSQPMTENEKSFFSSLGSFFGLGTDDPNAIKRSLFGGSTASQDYGFSLFSMDEPAREQLLYSFIVPELKRTDLTEQEKEIFQKAYDRIVEASNTSGTDMTGGGSGTQTGGGGGDSSGTSGGGSTAGELNTSGNDGTSQTSGGSTQDYGSGSGTGSTTGIGAGTGTGSGTGTGTGSGTGTGTGAGTGTGDGSGDTTGAQEYQRLLEEVAQIKAQNEEAAKKAAESARLATAATTLGKLSGMTGTTEQAPPVDTSIPLAKPDYLTTKGDTKYEGLLQDFQQKVDEQPQLPDNSTTDQENKEMSPYYSYGNEMPIETALNLGGDQQVNSQDTSQNPYGMGFYADGGMVAPLMAMNGGLIGAGTRHGQYATGGIATSPLMASGGKARVDFRHGDAVTGPGDGQSDDIPAMLADGEFVFPADVVAAIGNGSTKAGSDKLYEMMHGIRAHVRSAKPKDLPPEIKSPLDFLKTSKKRRA